jgi:hypothetical protein
MMLHCPFCSNQFEKPLVYGIKFCNKCERMIESNRKNKLLSGFRVCLKNTGKNIEKIKFDLKLSEQDFEIISKYIDECYSFQEFEKEINQMNLDQISDQ